MFVVKWAVFPRSFISVEQSSLFQASRIVDIMYINTSYIHQQFVLSWCHAEKSYWGFSCCFQVDFEYTKI